MKANGNICILFNADKVKKLRIDWLTVTLKYDITEVALMLLTQGS